MKWTDKQYDAIIKKPNILVRAAAGSGKTAVLTERIANKILPDETGDYIDVDRLLVVTFANKSAAEMVERLKKRLNDELLIEQDDERRSKINHQLDILPNAHISTIDSFCITLVRECFDQLDIDPRFGILDGKIAEKLASDVLDEVIEDLYDEENESFVRVADLYGGSTTDRDLIKNILAIKSFLSAMPNPNAWLKKAADNYSDEEWYHTLLDGCINAIRPIVLHNHNLLWDFVDEYKDNIKDENAEGCLAYKEAVRLEEMYHKLRIDNSWQNFDDFRDLIYYSKSFDIGDAEPGSFVFKAGTLLDTIAASYKPYANLFTQTSAEVRTTLAHIQEYATDLYNIYTAFEKALWEEKRKRSMFEFSDIEQMAYTILETDEGVRESYKRQFIEIMIDEYQDTNQLQESIFEKISNDNNRFMVGDIKQSIYRFRKSDPTIFKEKATKLDRGNMQGELISLNANFRSRSEVLDSCNAVFEKVMTADTAEVLYNEDERLNVGNTSYQSCVDKNGNSLYTSELVLLELDNALSKQELEAYYIADRIEELIGNFTVSDKEGNLRPCQAGDIAVLAPSVKDTAKVLIPRLEAKGISSLASGNSFFQTREVVLVINMLRLVNNPLQDIPLVSVMHSELFSFTDNELTKYRLADKHGFMYDALVAYAKDNEDEKLNAFLGLLEKWRKLSMFKKSCEVIWTIYMDTHIFEFLTLFSDVESTKRNLELLFQRAEKYEASGFRGLYDFINYLDRIKDVEEVEANAGMQENNGAVNILTIHASKGLEYPVVFLCGLNKNMFFNDTNGSAFKVNLHSKLGMGLLLFNQETMNKAQTMPQYLMEHTSQREELAEKIRLLYVALTRAREKLILVTHVKAKNPGEGISLFKEYMMDPIKISPFAPLEAKTYIDLLAPTILNGVAKDSKLWAFTSIDAGHYEREELPTREYKNPIAEGDELDEEEYKRIDAILSADYAYGKDPELPSRVYVTEVKHIIDGERNVEWIDEAKPRPRFMMDSKYSGTDVGNTYHTILSLIALQPQMTIDHIKQEVERLVSEKLISAEIAKVISLQAIQGFFESEPGKALLQSPRVEREARFVIPIPADSIFKQETNQQTLLQGIVDCWFDNGDGTAWVVDYKSDSLTDPAEYKAHYSVQLNCYKQAVERLTNLKVTKCFIYSLHLSQAIEI